MTHLSVSFDLFPKRNAGNRVHFVLLPGRINRQYVKSAKCPGCNVKYFNMAAFYGRIDFIVRLLSGKCNHSNYMTAMNIILINPGISVVNPL